MLLQNAVGRYLHAMRVQKTHRLNRRPSNAHIRRRKYGLQHLINQLGSDFDLNLITSDIVENAFINIRKKNGEPAAPASLNGYRESWLSFFKWAADKGIMPPINPDIEKGSYRSSRDKTIPEHILELVDSNLLKYSARKLNRLRDALMISLVADSGGRIGEIYNVLKSDVEYSLMRPFKVEVPRGDGTVEFVAAYSLPSAGKMGPVTLNYHDMTARLAFRFLERLPDNVRDKSPYLFVNTQTGKRVHPDTMQTGFQRFFNWLDTPVYYAHSFRHRKVTALDDQGVNSSTIARVTNHRSEQMINDHYLHRKDSKARFANARDYLIRQKRSRSAGLVSSFFRDVED